MENGTTAEVNAAPRLWTAPFFKVLSANTLSTLCNSMIAQALPLYVMALGSSKAVAGLIMGLFTITALISRPLFGLLIDSKGRRYVLLIGITLIMITCFGLSLTSALMIIFIIRSIQGAGFSAFTTSAATIVADVLPRNRLSEGIGYYGVSFNIAMSFGPALMLFMRDHWGYQSIFYVTGIISLLAFSIGSLLKYEKAQPKDQQASENKSKKISLSTMFEKSAIPGAMVLILISFPNGLVNTFLVKYSETLAISGIGLYFTFNAAFMILSRLLAGKLCDRFGVQRALPPGLLLIFGGLLIIAFARSLPYFLIAGSMLGFGYGVLFPTIQAFVMRSVPVERRGAASATYYSSQDLGRGAGAIMGGLMVQAIGFTASFAFYSLFIVGAFVMFNLVLRKRIIRNVDEEVE